MKTQPCVSRTRKRSSTCRSRAGSRTRNGASGLAGENVAGKKNSETNGCGLDLGISFVIPGQEIETPARATPKSYTTSPSMQPRMGPSISETRDMRTVSMQNRSVVT